MRNTLEVKNLSVGIQKVDGSLFYAVDGVSFKLYPKETLAIVGESGSGKTMTAMSVLGMLRSWNATLNPRIDGEILFIDRDDRIHPLHTYGDAEYDTIRGNSLSMIFQDPLQSLNPVARIGSQLTRVIRTHEPMSQRAAKTKAIQLLRLVGIREPEQKFYAYPNQFSGGQLQRIMIAMAISGETRCLIADEPTTALDVTIQAEILTLLKDIQKKNGMAMLLITHDLGVVSEIADRVAVMFAGRIVETGSVEEVFRKPIHPYTKLLIESIPSLETPPQVKLKTKQDFVSPRGKKAGERVFDPNQSQRGKWVQVSSTHSYTNEFTREVML